MPLNPVPIGDQIAEYLFGASSPGSQITLAQMKTIWENIMTMIYNDIKTNAEVLPSTMAITPSNIISAAPGSPCTGNGSVDVGTGTIT